MIYAILYFIIAFLFFLYVIPFWQANFSNSYVKMGPIESMFNSLFWPVVVIVGLGFLLLCCIIIPLDYLGEKMSLWWKSRIEKMNIKKGG